MYLPGVTSLLLIVLAFITCRLRLYYAVKLDSAVRLTVILPIVIALPQA